ncbi:MAG: response regulator, partial [Candidatus Binatia bacterium]
MAKILVAEDERRIRDSFVDILVYAGYDVIEAGDGRTAFELALRERPDLILLDLMMPEMDGFEVMKNLRENPTTEGTPVVVLTALPGAEAEQETQRLGAAHYIPKPCDIDTLEATVRVALREAGVSVSLNPGSDEDPDGEPAGDNTVNLTSVHTKNQTMSGQLARLKSGRKKDKDADEEGAETPVIKTGDKLIALEQKMGGGLPLDSVTLTVGAAASGKSSLCQHLVYGALEGGYGTAYFTSEQSEEDLIAQMSSIGLGVSQHLRKNQLRIHGVPEPTEDEKAEVLLNQLSQSMDRLSRGARFIVVDSLTDLAGSCPEQAVIAFFSACRRLGNQGRTIFISI